MIDFCFKNKKIIERNTKTKNSPLRRIKAALDIEKLKIFNSSFFLNNFIQLNKKIFKKNICIVTDEIWDTE